MIWCHFGTFMTWCHAAFSLRHTFAVFVRATQEVIKDSTGFRVFHLNFGRDFTGSDAVSPNRFTFHVWELRVGFRVPRIVSLALHSEVYGLSWNKPLLKAKHSKTSALFIYRLFEGVLLNIFELQDPKEVMNLCSGNKSQSSSEVSQFHSFAGSSEKYRRHSTAPGVESGVVGRRRLGFSDCHNLSL